MGGRSRHRWVLGCAALAFLATADGAEAAGDPARGRAKAALVCDACHGAEGISALENVPSLAGQPEIFTTLQLILFRERIRLVEAMQEVTRVLTDADVADFAAHYARLKPPAPTGPRDAAKAAQGAALAESLRCAACHERDHAGRDQMPRLAGQREDYLLHSMKEYRDSKRAGTDTTMTGVLYGLSDAQLSALAHYLAQFR